MNNRETNTRSSSNRKETVIIATTIITMTISTANSTKTTTKTTNPAYNYMKWAPTQQE